MPSVALVSVVALFRATLSSPDPLFPPGVDAGGPKPLAGVWAVLPPACTPPIGINLAEWPKCATPVGFLGDEVAALQRPTKGAADTGLYAVAKTKYVVASGDPAIVQLDVPTLFSRSTIYIAVTPDSLDASGHFEAATGWPLGCPAEPTPGVSLDGARCTALTTDGVRSRAQVPPDPAKTYRLVRIPAVDPAASPAAASVGVASPQAPAAAAVAPPP